MAIDVMGNLSMFFGNQNVNGYLNVNSGCYPYQNNFFGGSCFNSFGGFNPFGYTGGFMPLGGSCFGRPLQMYGGCQTPAFYGHRGGGYRECRDNDGLSNLLGYVGVGLIGYEIGKASKEKQESQAAAAEKK